MAYRSQTVAFGKTNREDVQTPVGGKTNFGGTVGYKGDTRVQRVAPGKGDLQRSVVPKTTMANPIGRRYESPIGPKQPGLTRGIKPLGNTPIAPVPKLRPTAPVKKAAAVKAKAPTKTVGGPKSVKATTPAKSTQVKTPVGMSRKEAMNNRLGVSSRTTTGKTSSSSPSRSSSSSKARTSTSRGFSSGSLKDRSTGGVSTGTKTGKTTSSRR